MHRRYPTVALLLLFAFCTAPAWAGPVRFGPRLGSSIPNLHAGDDNPISTGWSSRVAFAFGLMAEFEVSPSFSIQPEVNYAPQGGQRNGAQPVPFDGSALGLPPGTPIYARYDNTADIDYLEIPLLAKYWFGSARQVYATFGPYVGFLITAKNVTSGLSQLYYDSALTQPVEISPGVPYPPLDFGATTDIKSELQSCNWGIQGGVGYGRPLGYGRIELDLRGGYGLMNVQKDTAANGKNNTGSLVISLAYGVPVR